MSDLNVMIDIETMGNTQRAPIVSIGAVVFDVVEGIGALEDTEHFYTVINLEHMMKFYGESLEMDASTVLWWLKQSDAARGELLKLPVPTARIESVLFQFKDWWDENHFGKKTLVWAKPPSFDLSIMEHTFKTVVGFSAPWARRNESCLRTLQKLAGWSEEDEAQLRLTVPITQHNALHDAYIQAVCAQTCLARIRGVK